jgi:hypothetical protein
MADKGLSPEWGNGNHPIAWWGGYRFFSCSQDLSKVINGLKENHGKFTSLETSITGCNLTHDADVVLRRNPTIIFK